MFKSILALFKSGGWVVIPCIIATIAVMNWTVVNSKDNTIEELNEENVTMAQDIVDLNRELKISEDDVQELIVIRDSLTWKLEEDSVFYLSEKKKLQSTLLSIKRREGSLNEHIKNLETGLRIDLIEKTYRDPWIGKPKIIDSTYTEAWRWGPL